MHGPSIASLWVRSSFATLAVGLSTGCSGAPEPVEPLVPPRLDVTVRHWAGTALTGRTAGAATEALDPATCLAVTADLFYVDGPPTDALAPIASRTRLVVGARGDEPLLPVAGLSLGARVGSGPAARSALEATWELTDDESRARHLDRIRGALPVDVSLEVELESVDAVVTEDGQVGRRRVSILVSRDATDAVSVALQFDDIAPESKPGDEDEPPSDVLARQIVLLEDAPAIDGAPLILAAPSPFDAPRTRSIVAAIGIRSALDDDPTHARVVARCAADLRVEAAETLARRAAVAPDELGRRSLAAGLLALETVQARRPALVFLAGSGGAPLALDVALAGDDATVAAWLRTIDIVGGELPRSVDLGWLLERSAFALLAGRLDGGGLATDLRGLLAEHAGEAGRFPGTITAALARTSTRDEFRAAIVAENLDFLSTSDPSSRVRAFDWLAAQGLAPADYDPLGARETRRAALAAFEQARDAAAEGAAR